MLSPFRESETKLVSESRGDRFSITHPSGESDQISKPAAAVSKLASILHLGIPFTYQAARGNRRYPKSLAENWDFALFFSAVGAAGARTVYIIVLSRLSGSKKEAEQVLRSYVS